ncbi:DNA mismatch repair endonuclease MutL [Roseburia sp. AF22-2LB]|uniref:DNA mismatch repair endonuclease MutL n=1 Tax=unclassified Roseburia TaxID=2637578 RepID=UPI000E44244D|nr:DNA mismatch repair endonuclease MutL [Roseburia sp. AF42-8]RGG36556.1 DNA mismatch repair endonuclease MutL [Roseburia sp. AF22-8AC]RGG41560.1 DNA mismatch repair endonuclease MutL [Roseburia sp. AF22-2LB]RHS28469.1 DNA mismatch repair endonuclease MutL [Roseburia sp. AF12-17LB]
MPQIALLSQETIDKIAAGEVIERPSSVVKELVENAIDAGSSAVTVEIKEGGISFIRISDNGCGIEREQIPLAFLRHSTSKIKSVEDLFTVTSLGFRGEALSSIAAVSQVELITKTNGDFTGSRYLIEGSKEVSLEEIGAPDGTTFIVRNLFYNTPARKKFLKSAQTEGTYIHELMQRMILSHPDVAFKFIMNNQVKLQSSGNGNIKDIIYHLYGRDITKALLPIAHESELFKVSGFIGKPMISRGNRGYELYFVNGRFIRSQILSKAIEDAFKPFLMQHQYPFTVLYFEIDSSLLDVNVHPTKMELRFSNQQELYREVQSILSAALVHRDIIPEVPVDTPKKNEMEVPKIEKVMPEPFEQKRLEEIRKAVRKDSPYEIKYPVSRPMGTGSVSSAAQEKLLDTIKSMPPEDMTEERIQKEPLPEQSKKETEKELAKEAYVIREEETYGAKPEGSYEQGSFLKEEEMAKQKIIGQLFDTYWLVEYNDRLFIVDQHAAHEKVMYEKLKKQFEKKEFTSQAISPPIVITLSMREAEVLERFKEQFTKLGFEIEHFGGAEYSICGVPGNLYRLNTRDVLIEMLDELTDGISERATADVILDKIASMSCKAAVKGSQRLSLPEMEQLMKDLMKLDNPYNCPHGRPTIIAMSKYEIEKKFKRIV